MQGGAAAGGTLHRRRPAAAASPSPAALGAPLQQGPEAVDHCSFHHNLSSIELRASASTAKCR